MYAAVAGVKVTRGGGVRVELPFWKDLPVVVPHLRRETGPRKFPHVSGAAAAIEWDLAQGYLFLQVNIDGSRGAGPPQAAHMTARFRRYLRRPEVLPPDANA